jgi:AP-1 complex subunit mu
MIPVPPDIDTPKTRTTLGHASYVPAEAAIVWKIPYLPGGKEGTLHIKCGLPLIKNPTTIPSSREELEIKRHQLGPIRVLFEIPYFTMSGMQVRYLKIVEKSGYPALPWVRYITENGEYQFRMSEDIPSNKNVSNRKGGGESRSGAFSIRSG